MKHSYQKINNIVGLFLFAFATLIYWLCMEPTVSFWDCGEFIAASFKLEVGHQPGAPLFLMIGKMFSVLAGSDVSKAAYWVNFVSVISSAATVMFLFWTINAIAFKIVKKESQELSATNIIAIMLTGAVGALAYTFSDTFWFSAVEAEVYAISTLCTAIVFWAILKWENTTNDKWLLLIAFIIGLSIGMHLLSLLAIPTICLVYYFKKTKSVTFWATAKAFAIGCLLLGIVQFGIIQYLVFFAAKTDFLFVNSFGFGFGTGAVLFLLLVISALVYGVFYSIKYKKQQLNLAILSLSLVIFGFSSYFMIIIRADAKTFINLSNPDNPMALYGYLSRTQYEEKPLLYGKVFDSKVMDHKETGFTYSKGKSKYEISGKTYKTEYDKNILFPRTFSDKPQHVRFYQNWMGLNEDESPSFLQNLSFFNSYQMGFMYWRYFFWNFVGKQNNEQGHGEIQNGNWVSGIKPIDAVRLGNQNKLPSSIKDNAGNNLFYGLPLIIGLLGLGFLYRKNSKYAVVVASLFFCTGIAIILYINQDPLQVRERDYAYVGSFYAFAIVIGLGVLAVKEIIQKIASNKISLAIAGAICILAAPTIMAVQGWDDHDRSGKTTALDMAKNYLNSCEPNAILFTNADNDTYPLWYAQEVEGIRTDVRVVNLQFLSTSAYIDQMKKPQYKSAPLPIKLENQKYKDGVRDYFPFVEYGLADSVELGDLLSVLTSDSNEDKIQMNDGSYENFLPTKNIKLTINANDVLTNNVVPVSKKEAIADKLEWSFNGNYLLKRDLAMLAIIANNNWKRPIYFSTSVSEDTYIGLDKYLYKEGFAYHLLPLKPSNEKDFTKENQTNNELAYKHYINFNLGGFKTAKFLDQESRRVLNGTWRFANLLTNNLIQEKQFSMAKNVISKSLKELPTNNANITDTINRISLVQNLHSLGNHAIANEFVKSTTSYINQELDYILSLTAAQQQNFISEIEVGLYVLQSLSQISNHFKQQNIGNFALESFKSYQQKFLI